MASVKLFAPVDALPILTSGRNGSGFAAGRYPKFTLDNDPDTWWESSVQTDSALYYDLGVETTVDAVSFWLRNYNENYQDNRSFRVSHSDDDITYTPLTTRDFVDYRADYGPVVVDVLASPVAARYWRVEFIGFDDSPVGSLVAEVSAVWFMNDYSLPWYHQRPAQNKNKYHNNGTVTRSGERYSTPAGVGKQRVMQRKFVFTNDTGQWAELLNAYHAARGQNLPVVMQTEFDSEEYYAVQFSAPVGENQISHEYRTPEVRLQELGHKRVPFQDKRLQPLPETVGLWRFNSLDGTDESGSDNDFAVTGYSASDYTYGPTEQGITAVSGQIAGLYNLPGVDATDFNMGMDGFTVELWAMMTSAAGGSGTAACTKFVSNGGFQVFYDGSFRWGMRVGDGTNIKFADNGTVTKDDTWHLLTFVVRRPTDALYMFVDGVEERSVFITPVTGSIDSAAELKIFHLTVDDGILWDELCITKRALTDDEVAQRYAGCVNYGTWGM